MGKKKALKNARVQCAFVFPIILLNDIVLVPLIADKKNKCVIQEKLFRIQSYYISLTS